MVALPRYMHIQMSVHAHKQTFSQKMLLLQSLKGRYHTCTVYLIFFICLSSFVSSKGSDCDYIGETELCTNKI